MRLSQPYSWMLYICYFKILKVDILGVDILGVDILVVDILRLTHDPWQDTTHYETIRQQKADQMLVITYIAMKK